MRIAIISDIHGNAEAFKEVLKDIDRSDIDSVLCLGDNIGYGPEPNHVISMIREQHIPSVLGNHELAVVDRKYLEWFNPAARKSLQKTIKLLSDTALAFISRLDFFMVCNGCRFVHAFPPDSAFIYLFQVSENSLHHVFRRMNESLCFIGHTHGLEVIRFDGKNIFRAPLSEGIAKLRRGNKYIINAGRINGILWIILFF